MNTLISVSRFCANRKLFASSVLKFRREVFGNKIYDHYNEVAIYIEKRYLYKQGTYGVFGFKNDGAHIGWSDEYFIVQKNKYWAAVCQKLICQYHKVTHAPEEHKISPNSSESSNSKSLKVQAPPYDEKTPFLAQIVVNKELHKGGDRSCLHVELDISNSNMQYEAGDHVAIYPINDIHLVERLGELTGSNLDDIYSPINTDLENSKKYKIPYPTSYRTALSHYVEITALPDIDILKELIEYCSDKAEKEKLRLMTTNSDDGKSLYQSFVVETCRNIVHVLEDMKSCKPPLDHVCQLLPRLQPRYYSISSSPKVHPETVHVTAVVVKYKTSTGRVNKGITTAWLAELKPEHGKPLPRVPIYIRKSQFRLPLQSETPIIMVSSGTGLAPFRGFLQERAHARRMGIKVGDTVLYFGCRHSNQDYIYKEELEQYQMAGDVQLHVAFSRDQAHRVYVTHLLENNMDQLWEIIGKRNGHFYICGDARHMAVDVRNIVFKTIQEKGGRTHAQAVQFLENMESMKKCLADVWS